MARHIAAWLILTLRGATANTELSLSALPLLKTLRGPHTFALKSLQDFRAQMGRSLDQAVRSARVEEGRRLDSRAASTWCLWSNDKCNAAVSLFLDKAEAQPDNALNRRLKRMARCQSVHDIVLGEASRPANFPAAATDTSLTFSKRIEATCAALEDDCVMRQGTCQVPAGMTDAIFWSLTPSSCGVLKSQHFSNENMECSDLTTEEACTAQSGCANRTTYVQYNGTCAEQLECRYSPDVDELSQIQQEVTLALCNDRSYNMTAVSNECGAAIYTNTTVLMEVGALMVTNQTAAFRVISEFVSSCLEDSCPGSKMKQIMQASNACLQYADEESCPTPECIWGVPAIVNFFTPVCQFNPSMLEINLLMSAVPENCPFKQSFADVATCRMKPLSACTGACMNRTKPRECNGTGQLGPATGEVECTTNEDQLVQSLAGSSENAKMFCQGNVLGRSCQALTSEAACVAATPDKSTCGGNWPSPRSSSTDTDEASGAYGGFGLSGMLFCVVALGGRY